MRKETPTEEFEFGSSDDLAENQDVDEYHPFEQEASPKALVAQVLGATSALNDVLNKGSINRKNFNSTMPMKKDKSIEPHKTVLKKPSQGILIEKLDETTVE